MQETIQDPEKVIIFILNWIWESRARNGNYPRWKETAFPFSSHTSNMSKADCIWSSWTSLPHISEIWWHGRVARLCRPQSRMCAPPILPFLVATARYKVSHDKRKAEGVADMCAGIEETDRGHLCKGSIYEFVSIIVTQCSLCHYLGLEQKCNV